MLDCVWFVLVDYIFDYSTDNMQEVRREGHSLLSPFLPVKELLKYDRSTSRNSHVDLVPNLSLNLTANLESILWWLFSLEVYKGILFTFVDVELTDWIRYRDFNNWYESTARSFVSAWITYNLGS